MSAPTSTSTSSCDEFAAADNFMMDPDRDDSASFTEDNPDYRGFLVHDSIVDASLPSTTPPAILDLFSQLARAEKTSSNAIFEGTWVGIAILRHSEKTTLLRREGRWFVHRALDFLNLVAAKDKVQGHRLAAPGSLEDLCVRSMVQDMDQFQTLVEKHHECSTVARSRLRTAHKTQARNDISRQRQAIREVKKKLGFATKICRIASLPECPSTAPAMTLQALKYLQIRATSFGAQLAALQSEARFAAFPPLEMHLTIVEFLRAIEAAQAEVDEICSSERTRESSNADEDSHDMSLETDAEPTSATLALDVQNDFPKSVLQAELAHDRMSFETMDQILEYRISTYQQLAEVLAQLSTDLMKGIGPVTIQYMCIVFAHMLLFNEAAVFGELLVVMCREDEKRIPSVKNKVKIAAALGALSILLASTPRKFDAVQAAEEGINILQPVFKTKPARYISLMAALKAAHAKALLQCGGGLTNYEGGIRTLRKAYRIAEEASKLSHEHLDEHSTGPDTLSLLARVLYIKALGGLKGIEKLLDHQARARYSNFPLHPTVQKDRADRDSSKLENSKYLEGLTKDLDVEVIDALVTVSERSIQIYRELIKQVPNLYEPLLGEALILKAQLLNFYSPQAEDAFSEATAFYDQLSAKFPHQFDEPATRAYTGLAKRRRWANDLEGAADSYQQALDHLLEPLGPNEYKTDAQNQQWNRADELKIDRPVICVQLERYEEGLADLERVRAFMDEEDADIAGLAVQGCCYWLLGRLEEAEEVLTSGLEPIIEDQEIMKTIESSSSYRLWDENQGYILGLGWQGAVKSAMGDHTHALEDGELAVNLLRRRHSNAQTRYFDYFGLDPFQRVMLPHHLVILAGTLLAVGRTKDAMEHVEESLRLNSDSKVDPSTVKTALMLKARLLEETGCSDESREAAKIRAEADDIPFRGFLHRMGCSGGIPFPHE
ncbi:hypothetical protein A4X13_0g6805 [Tilletia indica]|uniref:Uncharacterized protein n=1 Tax=Tilletia indica TaxID=43049 RepID=A0A177TVD1_9BASI|nr:hypothetical protein A4X13_0g6805 [Tilletia indica]